MTPARLWKAMTLPQRERVARALWSDPDAAEDQAQAGLLIAQQKKFRPKTVISLAPDRKAHHLATLRTLPEPLAARVLIVYHLTEQRPMMIAFLDALGIKHENGLIDDNHVKPDPDKLAPATDRLLKEFRREDVELYLRTLVSQDPETWGALESTAATMNDSRELPAES